MSRVRIRCANSSRCSNDLDVARADGYLRRSDFSRWIGEVFGDHALARKLHGHELQYIHAPHRGALEQIVAAIKSRYDLTEENSVATAPDSRVVDQAGQVSTQAIQL